jgi:uncharacterized phage protein (predicted DNA packaging)
MAILDDVKVALRIAASNTTFDGEIGDLIEAAKDDLQLAGITKADESDALIKRAINTYCKAHYGYDNPDAERFLESYLMLKRHLALSVDYTEAVVSP